MFRNLILIWLLSGHLALFHIKLSNKVNHGGYVPTGRMIKLFRVKEKLKDDAESGIRGGPVYNPSMGQLRLRKAELYLPKSIMVSFPNGTDYLMTFEVSIKPDVGIYMGGRFVFSFNVSDIYPLEAPKVICKTKVYHPNIDLEGNVCLNGLLGDWNPVLNIKTLLCGLYYLFMEPNHDSFNYEAADVLRDNQDLFRTNVRRAMAGGCVGKTYIPPTVPKLVEAVEKLL